MLEPAEKVEMPLRLPSHEGSGLKYFSLLLSSSRGKSPLA